MIRLEVSSVSLHGSGFTKFTSGLRRSETDQSGLDQHVGFWRWPEPGFKLLKVWLEWPEEKTRKLCSKAAKNRNIM